MPKSVIEVTDAAMLSKELPRLVPGNLHSQAYAQHLRYFRHVLLFHHMGLVEGLELLGSLVVLEMAPPEAACLLGDSRLNGLSLCIPRVPIQHRVTPGISGNHTPGRLIVRVLQEAQREPNAATLLR